MMFIASALGIIFRKKEKKMIKVLWKEESLFLTFKKHPTWDKYIKINLILKESFWEKHKQMKEYA